MPNPPAPAAIRARREALGLSQAALAARIGCHEDAVAAWEHGRRRPSGLYLRELLRVLAPAGTADDERSEDR